MHSLLKHASIVLLAASQLQASPVYTRQASFTQCLSDGGLSPVTPDSSDYSQDSAAYNQRLQPSPAALITPSSSADISTAIKCASAASIPVVAKSGGHSYASFSLGGVDEQALVISLSNFRNLTVDEQGVAKIGTGNRLGDVALVLNQKGRGLPHGVCPWVGVGGHASFGGFGLASRLYGLMLDTIVSFDAVLANGTVVENVTRQTEPDLFWAAAGAAPDFALVTAFSFQSQPVPSSGIIFSYSYSDLSPSDLTKAFLAYQSFGASSAPPELGISFTVGKGSLDISGAFYDSRATFDSTIELLLDKLPAGYTEEVKEMSWIETLQDLAGSQSLNTSEGQNSRDSFFAKSLMTPEDKPITEDAANAFFTYLQDTETDTNWFVEINLYGGNGSAINEKKTLSDNSFAHRDSLLTFQMYASSSTYGNPYPQYGVDFVQGMYGALVSPMLQSWGSDYGAYVNYVDPTLTDDQVRSLYWATQYDRLSTLKKRYDPNEVFKRPQSIAPASA